MPSAQPRPLTRSAAAIACLLLAGSQGAAWGKETITYAYQIDPMFEAALWAIKNGKVSSDKIEIDATPLAIPALIQAMPTKRYDVIQSDVIGVPRSAERGLQLRILSTAIRYRPEGDAHIVFTPKDSPIRGAPDLKGKKVAVTSLGSTGFHNLRFALGEGWGLNVDIAGGDITWVELPAPTMFGALHQKRVDGASLSLTYTYRAKVGGEFNQAVQAGKKMYELFKLQMISSVNMGYPEKMDVRPELYREFNRMLKESAEYMHAHGDEVYAVVGKAYNVEPEMFRGLQATLAEFPLILQEKDIPALAKEWELAQKYKLLKSVPDVKSFIWPGVVVEK
ncbi:MAG: ABC transporter substrate-binding protein [Xanthobacteraceae bacterium]